MSTEAPESAYQQTVEMNKLVAGYALGYQQTEDIRYIRGMYDLLRPITEQVGRSFLSEAGLPGDLLSDIVQESFLALEMKVQFWSWDRNPVFITFWRQTFKNYLITIYQPQWRHKSVPDTFEQGRMDPQEAILILKDLRRALELEISTWPKLRDKLIAAAVVNQRIFKLDIDKPKQKELGEVFGLPAGIISNWEVWLKKRIIELGEKRKYEL
jgi:hypothetical protein